MFIKKIRLLNFRNYENLTLDLSKQANIFVGNNGQGKTNLLESIYVLAVTKSHRSYIDNSLIIKGKDFCLIDGTVENINKKINNYQLTISNKGKKVSINSKKISRISDFIGKIKVVMFCPDDINLVKSSPNTRRKFFNVDISQLNPVYSKNLVENNNILKNRNKYLKESYYKEFDDIYFSILTDKLIEKEVYIVRERIKYFEILNTYLKKIYFDITGKNNLRLLYKPFSKSNFSDDDILKNLKEEYAKNLDFEKKRGITLNGIHKEDFSILLDNEEISLYGSQGQQRLAVLCLKLAEIEIFKEISGEYPILLLDDLLSELDEFNKNSILKYINKDIQTIITTTNLELVSKDIIDKSRIYKVCNGFIEVEENNGRK